MAKHTSNRLEELPPELLQDTFSHLSARQICTLRRLSTFFKAFTDGNKAALVRPSMRYHHARVVGQVNKLTYTSELGFDEAMVLYHAYYDTTSTQALLSDTRYLFCHNWVERKFPALPAHNRNWLTMYFNFCAHRLIEQKQDRRASIRGELASFMRRSLMSQGLYYSGEEAWNLVSQLILLGYSNGLSGRQPTPAPKCFLTTRMGAPGEQERNPGSPSKTFFAYGTNENLLGLPVLSHTGYLAYCLKNERLWVAVKPFDVQE